MFVHLVGDKPVDQRAGLQLVIIGHVASGENYGSLGGHPASSHPGYPTADSQAPEWAAFFKFVAGKNAPRIIVRSGGGIPVRIDLMPGVPAADHLPSRQDR